MSTFRVPVTRIREVCAHPNADRLEIVKIYDWSVVAQKGVHKASDLVVYIPVDSILPQELEDKLFGVDSKIKPHKHRIRSIKIRGEISQGMIYSDPGFDHPKYSEEDVSGLLGITKYEPPVKDLPKHMQVAPKKKVGNPNFKKYSDIENFKYYDRTIKDGDPVYISEKLHGTSFRAGWFKTEANTVWKKIKKLFGQLPEYEFCYGSRMVEISAKRNYTGYYGTDVYGKIVEQYSLESVIPKGQAVYGEIVGDGIQKNYTYGCKKDEHRLFVYDVMDTSEKRWLDYPQFKKVVSNMGLERVPELYVGEYSREILDKHRDGDSTIGGQKVREGIVVRPIVECRTHSLSRVILKYISDAYYFNITNSDFH